MKSGEQNRSDNFWIQSLANGIRIALTWVRVLETVNGFLIERVSEGSNTVPRLSGHLETEHIQQLRSEIGRGTLANGS